MSNPQPEVASPGGERVAFVTNFCPHYRVRVFESFARLHDTTYFFFSAGGEWYWQQAHGVSAGDFKYEYLPGFRLGTTRVTPSLIWKLLRGRYDVFIKCINGRFALPLTLLIARLRGRPFVLWTEIWMRLQSPIHRLMWPVTRFIYNNADAIVVPGEHGRQYLISEGVNPEKIFGHITSIDNAAYNQPVPEAERQATRAQLGIAPNAKVVLFLGRLVEVKGLPWLIEALAQANVPNAVLVLAGKGGKEAELRARAKALGISDRVRFAGYVPVEDTLRHYAIADVLVLPSITLTVEKETWGLVINEAFNQGVPAIATNAVGAAMGGLVTDGETGFIVPERNAGALAEKLALILNDDALRTRLGDAARARVATWDNDTMAQGFHEAVAYALRQRAR